MQALYARTVTGEGRHIAVSLYHALSDWMNVPYLQYVYGGKVPERSGLKHPTIAPYGAYVCSDSKSILFSIQNEREWQVLCAEALARPDLASDERFNSNSQRVANRSALDAEIIPIIAALSRDEMAERLQSARIAYGRISTLEDLAAHPQNRYTTVETPSGPVRILAPGFLADGEQPVLGKVPGLGEDSDRIRAEFNTAPTAD